MCTILLMHKKVLSLMQHASRFWTNKRGGKL